MSESAPPTPAITPADALELLCVATKLRAAQKLYHHLRTYYVPHQRETVEGYEADLDRLIARLSTPPEGETP